MATAADIAELDTEELERQLTETRRELFNLRFQLATGQLDNSARIGQVKKDVARMLTELRNREIAEAEGLALADLDEDGLVDLVVAGGPSYVTTLRALGTAGVPNGTFAAPVNVNTTSTSRGVIAGDWNGDGITDLAVAGSGVRLLLGNGAGGKGDGTFTLSPDIYSTGSTPNHMASADLNLDGIPDLVVCNTGASSLTVLLGNGTAGVPDGTFAPPVTVTTTSGPNTVQIADWDQNGVPDLAVASNNTSNASTILLGLGTGLFEAGQTFATGGSNPAALAVNDFNRDGAPDLFVCNRLSQSTTRQLANCPGVLSRALAITSPVGGESWQDSTEQTITWTKGVGVMTVDLQRSNDGGGHWVTLARGLSGTSYKYTVAAPFVSTAPRRGQSRRRS